MNEADDSVFFKEIIHQTDAQDRSGTAVSVRALQPTTSTRCSQLVYAPPNHSASSTGALRSKPKCHRETGSGQV